VPINSARKSKQGKKSPSKGKKRKGVYDSMEKGSTINLKEPPELKGELFEEELMGGRTRAAGRL